MTEDFVPRLGGMYRFPTGIRVVLSEPFLEGKRRVVVCAQPRIDFHPNGDRVLMDSRNIFLGSHRIFRYPGISHLEVDGINREYPLAPPYEDNGELWCAFNTVILKVPVKKKRKPRKKKQ